MFSKDTGTREQNLEMCCLKKEQQRERNCTLLHSFVSEVGIDVVTMDCFGLGKVDLCTLYLMMELIVPALNAHLSYTVGIYNWICLSMLS